MFFLGNLAAIQPVQQKLSKPVAIAPSPAQPVQNRGTESTDYRAVLRDADRFILIKV